MRIIVGITLILIVIVLSFCTGGAKQRPEHQLISLLLENGQTIELSMLYFVPITNYSNELINELFLDVYFLGKQEDRTE